jgi:four helix bundle protein
MTVKRYSDLVAWQKAMDLVENVYQITKGFPKEELYGLTSQLRRASISIPSNIAEGHCRNGSREFVHHLSIALGSLGETETQMLIAQRLGYIAEGDVTSFVEAASETGRIIVGLMHSLDRKLAPGPSPLAAARR